MRILSYFLFACLLLLITQSLHATIIHVPSDSTTIQGGINGAMDGDTVMVAPGTYHEHGIDFLGKAISVMGTNPEDSAVVASTVLDGDSLGSVFVFQSGEDTTSVLAGLTITGGRAYNGGGVHCNSSSPIIRDNIITANSAIGAGGIFCGSSNPLIINNLISENSADSAGGGISCSASSPKISNNTIIYNLSHGWSGAGMYLWSSAPLIVNNIIASNIAIDQFGGGIRIGWASNPTLTNNTITGNQADNGGGIDCYPNVLPIITNCILWGNSGDEIYSGNPVVTYSNIEGGWPGQGNIDEDPLFINPNSVNYYLRSNSPCIDTGDPTILDACRPPGLGEERSDMGAFGGVENCGWPPLPDGIYLSLTPTGSTNVPQGGILYFDTFILNNRANSVEGDCWLSAILPNSNEVLIPERLLNFSNPLHGRVFPFNSVELSNELWIHPRADTGSYQLIGRIGQYPARIFDEESFGFRVVE